MLTDALRWNLLNVVRVELFFNCFKLYDIFYRSSFKSPRGQHALASFAITLVAMATIQFNWSWLLTVYSLYLLTGMAVWLYRRVYFYHRKLDSIGVNQTINHFEASRLYANGVGPSPSDAHSTATLAGKKHHHQQQQQAASAGHQSHAAASGSSAAAPSSSASSTSADSGNTNSLQRQRASAYRDFRTVLSEPRHSPREFALSLAHLSHVAKLVADKDVFDEMHFQILATRRDVVNMLLRLILLVASSLLSYV